MSHWVPPLSREHAVDDQKKGRRFAAQSLSIACVTTLRGISIAVWSEPTTFARAGATGNRRKNKTPQTLSSHGTPVEQLSSPPPSTAHNQPTGGVLSECVVNTSSSATLPRLARLCAGLAFHQRRCIMGTLYPFRVEGRVRRCPPAHCPFDSRPLGIRPPKAQRRRRF